MYKVTNLKKLYKLHWLIKANFSLNALIFEAMNFIRFIKNVFDSPIY